MNYVRLPSLVALFALLTITSFNDACPPRHRHRRMIYCQPIALPPEVPVNDCDAVLKSQFVQLLRLPKEQYDKVDPLILKHEWDSISVQFNKCMKEKYGDTTVKLMFYNTYEGDSIKPSGTLSKLFIFTGKAAAFNDIKKQLPIYLSIRDDLIAKRPQGVIETAKRQIGELKKDYRIGNDVNYQLFHEHAENLIRDSKETASLFSKLNSTCAIDSGDSLYWSKGLRISTAVNRLDTVSSPQVVGKKNYYWKVQFKLEKINDKVCSLVVDVLVASRLATQSENTMQWISYRKTEGDLGDLTFNPKEKNPDVFMQVKRFVETDATGNGTYSEVVPEKSTAKSTVFHELEKSMLEAILAKFFNS